MLDIYILIQVCNEYLIFISASCADHKDCQTLVSTLGASGQDVCLNTNLNHYCNSTCGLCPGQTSRGMIFVHFDAFTLSKCVFPVTNKV